MAATAQQLLESLSRCELLRSADLEDLAHRIAADPNLDAITIAEDLMHRGLLTTYQVQVLVHGRSDPLQLGNYVILDEVGAGGMGRVFKAFHRRMDRVVALKIIKTETLGSSAAVQRFQQEVKMAAKLHHPNIVTAYDADEADGVQYLVMEFVEGDDLGSIVRHAGPLSIKDAVDFMVQAAQGLAYAHDQGVIHRDIKPSNLLLDQHGVVKVLDMGLARTTSEINRDAETNHRAELTATGMVFGTVDYISPEQALSARKADNRSDIYSLGCCLYYLLVGRPIFQGDTLVEVLMMHREAHIPALQSVRDDVPDQLVTIFEKMVAKDPNERYASMHDIVSDLRDLAHTTELAYEAPTVMLQAPPGGLSIGSEAPTLSGSRWRTQQAAADKGRRRRLLVMASAVGGIVLVAIIVLASFLPGRRGKRQEQQVTGNAPIALADLIERVEPAVVRLEVQGSAGAIGSGFIVLDDGTTVTNFHVIRGAQAIRAKFHDGASTSAMGIRAIDEANDLALIKLNIPSHRKVMPLPLADQLPRKGASVIAFGAPLGLSFTASEGIVSSVRTGDELKEIIAQQAGALEPDQFSSDSVWVQTTAPISSGNSGGPLLDERGNVVGVNTWVFRTGQNLNFAVSAKVVQSLLAESSDELQPLEKLAEYTEPKVEPARIPKELTSDKAPGEMHRFTSHKDEVLDLAISRSGRFLASASKDKTVHLHNLETLSFIYELKSDVAEAWSVAFSHDEALLITGWDDNDPLDLKIYDRKVGGAPKQELNAREYEKSGTRALTVAADGRSMASVHELGIVDLRRMANLEGVSPLVAHDRSFPCYDAAFSEDGRLLATCGGDGMVIVWLIDEGAGYTHMQVHEQAVRAIAISRDNTYFATASDDKTLRVWSPWRAPANWQLYKQLDDHASAVTCVAFHKDGTWIASGGDDNVVRIWNLQTDEKHAFTGHEGGITQVAFLPQGDLLASSSRDGSIRLWRLPFSSQESAVASE